MGPLLSPDGVDRLFGIAEQSILSGFNGGGVPPVDLAGMPGELSTPCGVFVTLEVQGVLNGCIGTIEPADPLAVATAHNAFRAAFHDPRLPALESTDWPDLIIEISLLSQLEEMNIHSEEELMEALRPGIDGLVLSSGPRRATFLPVMWERLPSPGDFVHLLERKGGMPVGFWMRGMRAWRYTADGMARHASPLD